MKQIPLPAIYIDVIACLDAGKTTTSQIKSHLSISPEAAYQRLTVLINKGLVKGIPAKNCRDHEYTVISDNYIYEGYEEDDGIPHITPHQAEILIALRKIDVGRQAAKDIAEAGGFLRGSVTHSLTALHKAGLVIREDNPKGPVRVYGFLYTATDNPHKVGFRRSHKKAATAGFTFAALDAVIGWPA